MTLEIQKQLLDANHSKGRTSLYPVDTIVVHVMEGDMAGTLEWFRDQRSQVSSHYGVSKKGAVVQYVDEEDRAWHAGRVHEPTAEIVLERGGVNPNQYTIGIEHEGSGSTDLTDEQRTASAMLIADIARRRHIPLTRKHVVGHHEIYSLKGCPRNINIDKLIAEALAYLNPAPRPPAPPPRVVWSDYFKDYLIVTAYRGDSDWEFVPLKSLPKGVKAQAPLSHFRSQP